MKIFVLKVDGKEVYRTHNEEGAIDILAQMVAIHKGDLVKLEKYDRVEFVETTKGVIEEKFINDEDREGGRDL